MFDYVDEQVITLADGVELQWLAEGRIASFTVTKVSREAIDAWIDTLKEIEFNDFHDRPILTLHQLTAFPLTPYARHKITSIVNDTSNLRGKTAGVFPHSIFSSVIRFFVERELRHNSSSFQRRVFTDRNEAIAWLLA